MAAAVELDLSQFDRATRRMLRAGSDLRPAFRMTRGKFRADQKDHMKAETASDGTRWARLAPSTIAKRLSRGGRAGKFTKRGKLKKAARRKLNKLLSNRLTTGAKISVRQREMSIRGQLDWFGVHQRGGIVGKGARVPQREFLWVSDPFMEQLTKTIATGLVTAWGKKK